MYTAYGHVESEAFESAPDPGRSAPALAIVPMETTADRARGARTGIMHTTRRSPSLEALVARSGGPLLYVADEGTASKPAAGARPVRGRRTP